MAEAQRFAQDSEDDILGDVLRDADGQAIYCCNDPCEAEATCYRRGTSGDDIPLCATCAGGYDIGEAWGSGGGQMVPAPSIEESPARVWVVVAEYSGVVDDALAFVTEQEAQDWAKRVREAKEFKALDDTATVWECLVGECSDCLTTPGETDDGEGQVLAEG